MGVLLFVLSAVLGLVLLPVGIVYSVIKCFINAHFKQGVKTLNDKFRNLAKAFDQYGNYVCAELFNATLVKNNGWKFGNISETISSVVAKNHQSKTLTLAGRILCFILIHLNDPSFKQA